MALISLRQMLDHAAEHGYGVPAFNVNNLEQIHAIMEAAQETDSPVILQASAGARKYAGEAYLRHMMLAAVETHPDIPVVVHQDHGTSAAVCQQSIRSGFTSVMMDGSLMSDGKTPASYEYNVDITRRVCEMSHAGRRVGRRRTGLPGLAGNRRRRRRRRHRRRGQAQPRPDADRPGAGQGLCRENRRGRPGHCHRHQPRRLQVHPQAHGRHSGHRPHRRHPRADSQHPPGDARLQQRAAGVAGHHSPVRRRHQGNLWRAGGRNPARHPAAACARSTSTPTSAWP